MSLLGCVRVSRVFRVDNFALRIARTALGRCQLMSSQVTIPSLHLRLRSLTRSGTLIRSSSRRARAIALWMRKTWFSSFIQSPDRPHLASRALHTAPPLFSIYQCRVFHFDFIPHVAKPVSISPHVSIPDHTLASSSMVIPPVKAPACLFLSTRRAAPAFARTVFPRERNATRDARKIVDEERGGGCGSRPGVLVSDHEFSPFPRLTHPQ